MTKSPVLGQVFPLQELGFIEAGQKSALGIIYYAENIKIILWKDFCGSMSGLKIRKNIVNQLVFIVAIYHAVGMTF